jgi:N,N'-diacetyllegionaminate synthase
MSFLDKYEKKTFIIAEIGVNHNGNLDIAKKLIEVAKECGANAVKFQTFKTEKVISQNAPKAEYQKTNENDKISQYEMVKKLELTKDDFLELKKYSEKNNIIFISTPFDLDSVELLNEINVELFKVGSGDCDNFLLLNKIMETNKPMIISTGMSDIEEIKNIQNFLHKNNYQNKYIFLHCISSYPAPYEQMNMSCIKYMHQDLNVPIGFSDHTINNIASIMAVTYGATCIEKHITLDNEMEGPDHKASLNPMNFKNFVDVIRETEKMIGNGEKKCMPCEENTKMVARKNLFYTKNLKKNANLKYSDLEALRPNINGITPINLDKLIGAKLNNDVFAGELVSFEHFYY